MEKIYIQVDRKEIEKAIKKLEMKDKIKIFEELKRETRKARWNELILKIREKANKFPLTQKEITQICEKTRDKIYKKKNTGSS